jgi:hypothetical protein
LNAGWKPRVGEVEQDHVVDPPSRQPLEQRRDQVTLRLHDEAAEVELDRLEGDIQERGRLARTCRAEQMQMLQQRPRGHVHRLDPSPCRAHAEMNPAPRRRSARSQLARGRPFERHRRLADLRRQRQERRKLRRRQQQRRPRGQ